MDSLTTRPMEPGDLSGVLDLAVRCLGERPGGDAELYWRWKHEESPFGPSLVILALDGSRIVGLRAFMRWEWRSSKGTLRAVRAVDTATDPDFRRRGIFSRLTRELIEVSHQDGVDFIFNTPNEKSRPGYLKLGWSDYGRPTLWVRARSLVSMARRTTAPTAETDLSGFGLTRARDLPAASWSTATMGVLTSTNRYIATPRTLEYLEWRYAHCPGRPYWIAQGGPGNEAYLMVLSPIVRRGVQELRVCELLLGEGRQSEITARRRLVSLAKQSRAQLVVGANPGDRRIRSLFLRAGMFPIPRSGPGVTVNRLSSTALPEKSSVRLAYSLGDLELF